MSQTTINMRSALIFAVWRAGAVLWGGLVALGLYILVITFGPSIEGRIAPVLINYELTEVRSEENGGFSFVSRFYKQRDCSAYGTAWFAQDPQTGDLGKINARRLDDPGPIETGPTGPRVGTRQAFYPPAGSRFIMGVANHDCGYPWQTRTPLGPFPIIDGLPVNLEDAPAGWRAGEINIPGQ